MNNKKIGGYLFVAIFMGAAAYVAAISELPVPGRVIAGIEYIQRPWTYFISASLASLGLTIALLATDEKKYKNVATLLFILSFALFWIGAMAGGD
jgi:hypothetical protein